MWEINLPAGDAPTIYLVLKKRKGNFEKGTGPSLIMSSVGFEACAFSPKFTHCSKSKMIMEYLSWKGDGPACPILPSWIYKFLPLRVAHRY